MTQYSSREPFNDDPEPWLFISDQVFGVIRSAHDKGYHDVSGTYWVPRPRPEFDRTQTNPTNPVLTVFRKQKLAPGETAFGLARWWLAFGVPPRVLATDDEWSHARRVLARLANLKEES